MIMDKKSSFWKIGLESNKRKFYLISFFEALWFPLPVFILYLMASGMNLGQIGILLSMMVLAQVIFEIPSSVLADKYSRKKILLIGGIFLFLSNLILYAESSFEYFSAAMFFMGLSAALRSGTDSAIVYDTLLNLGKERMYGKIQSKIMVCFFWSRIVASVAGTFAYFLDSKLPFIMAVFSALALVLVLSRLEEPKFNKSANGHLNQVKEGIRLLVNEKSIWLVVLTFSLMLATSDVLFYNYQPILNSTGLTVLYLSFVYVGINISSSMGSMLYPYILRKIGRVKLLAVYLFTVVFCSLAFMTKNLLLALLFIALLSFNFGNEFTYITDMINRIVPSSHRATTISIQSQLYLLLFSAIIVVVGKISEYYSISHGMAANLLIAIMATAMFFHVRSEIILE